jgi:hypothetical protein
MRNCDGTKRPSCGIDPARGGATKVRKVAMESRMNPLPRAMRICRFCLLLLLLSLVIACIGCGSSSEPNAADASGATGPRDSGSNGVDATASRTDSESDAAASGAESEIESGADAAAEGAPSVDTGPLPADPCIEAGTCPPGTWINVTPSGMSRAVLAPATNAFGPGAIVGDPARPSDLYIGAGNDGLWKSTDYGTSWTRINSTIAGSPIGTPIAVAGTTPATLWINSGKGDGSVYKSTDGGSTFLLVGGGQIRDLYSIQVDPYDPTHLISGLHEADGLVESTDGGSHWHTVGGTGWPAGGVSWYPFFIDTANAATTRRTWFAIAQNGASAVITNNEGATWTVPNGLASPSDAGVNGLQHPHGCARLDQRGSTLFVAGVYGPGQGVYRSVDMGANWSRVDTGKAPEAVVWSTPKNVYAMWGWACSDCNLGTNYETAAQPGSSWSNATVPAALVIGPNSLAVTNDGTHSIFVGVMWAAGIWRYVEP